MELIGRGRRMDGGGHKRRHFASARRAWPHERRSARRRVPTLRSRAAAETANAAARPRLLRPRLICFRLPAPRLAGFTMCRFIVRRCSKYGFDLLLFRGCRCCRCRRTGYDVRCGGRLTGELRQQHRSVCASAVSAPLRSTKWIAPWVLASTARFACSGVSNSVTTVTSDVLPSGSGSSWWPAARTTASCSTVAVTGSGVRVRVVGHQYVEMRAGDQKSGHPDHLVGAQRDGAHSVRNLAG